MKRRKKPVLPYQKLVAALGMILVLSNACLLLPAYAASAAWPEQPAAGQAATFCLPIPIIHPCKSPTPGPTQSPTPTATVSATPAATSTRTPGGPTPPSTLTATPTSTPPTGPQVALKGAFTLTATEIVGTNAHLDLADVLHPVLSFSAVSIEGLKVTHQALTLSATGNVSGSGVAIKTSAFQDLVTALGSFTDKADLLLLLAGVTVKRLTMKNVSLQVDRSIQMQSLTLNGLAVS